MKTNIRNVAPSSGYPMAQFGRIMTESVRISPDANGIGIQARLNLSLPSKAEAPS